MVEQSLYFQLIVAVPVSQCNRRSSLAIWKQAFLFPKNFRNSKIRVAFQTNHLNSVSCISFFAKFTDALAQWSVYTRLSAKSLTFRFGGSYCVMFLKSNRVKSALKPRSYCRCSLLWFPQLSMKKLFRRLLCGKK